MAAPEQVEQDEILYCTVHPNKETTLRCNKCGRPMCAQCAVQTPVGYRCRECVRGIQDDYYKATQNDYIVIFAVCAGLTGIVSAIYAAIHLGILFAFLLGLVAGGVIGEGALRLTSRRRGRQSANIAAGGAVIGGLAGSVLQVLLWYNSIISQLPPDSRPNDVSFVVQLMTTSNIDALIFVGLIAVAIYGRFKMRS
jgi:B-box zinc finger